MPGEQRDEGPSVRPDGREKGEVFGVHIPHEREQPKAERRRAERRGVHHVQVHTAAERPGVLRGCGREVRRRHSQPRQRESVKLPAEGFRVDKRRAEQRERLTDAWNDVGDTPWGQYLLSRTRSQAQYWAERIEELRLRLDEPDRDAKL